MPLLAEVYKSMVDSGHASLNEVVVVGDVEFAAVDRHGLEYDPGASIGFPKSTFYANPTGWRSPASSVYHRCISEGPTYIPGSSTEIELSRVATNADQLSLLVSDQGYFDEAPPRPVSRSSQYYQQSPLGGGAASGAMQQGHAL